MSKLTTHIFVFDLDGVITDPENSQVSEEVVGLMYGILRSKGCLAVNTGRPYDWVEEHLIRKLQDRKDPDIFTRLIVVCEKGGESVVWYDGAPHIKPSQFALTDELYQLTKSTFEQNKRVLSTMFWDRTKRTMATIEKLPSARLADFHSEQLRLVGILSSQLRDHNVKIDPTTIATDVESLSAGKYAGAELIYNWNHSRRVPVAGPYVSIGDSASDYEMARYFAEQGAASTFVYVGKPTDKIIYDARVSMVVTKGQYALGTLEYLSSLQELETPSQK